MDNSTCSFDGCDTAVHPTRNKSGMCKRCSRRDYYRRNKVRENAQNKAYREARPEYWKERWQEFYTVNYDELKAKRKARYDSDPEKYREVSSEYRRRNPGVSDRWRKQNPELWKMRNRENARRRRATDGDPVDYELILAEHGMVCHICDGDIADVSDLHFDHVIPLSKGGPHIAENIKPSHARCNLSKGARTIA